jgi:hypothetical protein
MNTRYIYIYICRLRAFENRVLRKIFGPKRGEVTGGWRKLHNEELHILYSYPSIIRMIKSRKMRWAGHVARIWEKMEYIKDIGGKSIRKEHWKDQDVGDWTILKEMLEREDRVVETGPIWLRIGTSGWLL